MKSEVAITALLLGVACATGRPASRGAPASLVIAPGQLEHEVRVTGPGRDDVLRGVLTFSSTSSFSLKAFTPFGMDLFELGRSQDKFHHTVAAPLKGKLPVEAMARDVWRIYFGRCPTDQSECIFDDARLTQLSDADGHLQRRTFVDASGRVTNVSYADWQEMQGVLHPRKIVLSSGQWSLRIHAVGLTRRAVSSTN